MEFAPLQLAPALVVGVMYWLRARTITVPTWRVWCFYGGLAPDGGDARALRSRR